MKEVASAGGIVFNNLGQVLLIHNKTPKDPNVDYWGFPKGHLEENENIESGAAREVLEETGISVEIIGKVGEIKYVVDTLREGGKAQKIVHLFLMRHLNGKLTAQEGEISDIGWFVVEDAEKTLDYEKDKELLRKAVILWNNRG